MKKIVYLSLLILFATSCAKDSITEKGVPMFYQRYKISYFKIQDNSLVNVYTNTTNEFLYLKKSNNSGVKDSVYFSTVLQGLKNIQQAGYDAKDKFGNIQYQYKIPLNETTYLAHFLATFTITLINSEEMTVKETSSNLNPNYRLDNYRLMK
jgi:hypothetical protein